MRLNDLNPETRIFALFKGDPKTGKDIAAHSFALAGPVYTFDLDARMESVAAYYTNVVPRPDIMSNIEYDRFTDFFALHRRLEELKAHCPYKTVIMSSLTSLARKAMNTMLSTRDPKSLNKEDQARARIRGGIPMHIIEDFGGEANAIMLTMDSLIVLSIKFNVNVIMTAHVIQPEAGAYSKRTLLTGGKKIAGEIPTSFNEAYHFYVQTSGGMEIGVSNTDRRFIAMTQSTSLDWAATALDIPEMIDFTAGKTSGLFYAEMMKNVRQPNKVNEVGVTL
jgi:hypothetical protein